ncbi:unnamed protein product [Durusdinium trenchii]|uniref:SET domain-containing protein n=1 Tax=Durusdinium trenchii TaxID=1381693 RepID=A0ABP0LTW6_9DINO
MAVRQLTQIQHGLSMLREARSVLAEDFSGQLQCKKVNVKICEFGDVAYFRTFKTTKEVRKGGELITDYGSQYWEDFEGC